MPRLKARPLAAETNYGLIELGTDRNLSFGILKELNEAIDSYIHNNFALYERYYEDYPTALSACLEAAGSIISQGLLNDLDIAIKSFELTAQQIDTIIGNAKEHNKMFEDLDREEDARE